MQYPPEGQRVNFIEGVITMGGAGSSSLKVSLLLLILDSLIGRAWHNGILLQREYGKGGLLLLRR